MFWKNLAKNSKQETTFLQNGVHFVIIECGVVGEMRTGKS
jgi:hypothetical protein